MLAQSLPVSHSHTRCCLQAMCETFPDTPQQEHLFYLVDITHFCLWLGANKNDLNDFSMILNNINLFFQMRFILADIQTVFASHTDTFPPPCCPRFHTHYPKQRARFRFCGSLIVILKAHCLRWETSCTLFLPSAENIWTAGPWSQEVMVHQRPLLDGIR